MNMEDGTKNINNMNYAELQALAKQRKVKANGKLETLRKRLSINENNRKRKAEGSPDEEPKPKFVKNNDGSAAENIEAQEDLYKQFFENDPILQANRESISGIVSRLIEAWVKSGDLPFQRAIYGQSLQKPLPLRETLHFDNFFSEDILTTRIYDEFTAFVQKITESTKPDQSLLLGTVVQVSGYGKTHIARAYTRKHNAIYFKFSDRTNTNNFCEKIEAIIRTIRNKTMPTDINERTGTHYKTFTNLSLRALEIFILAAIEHYTFLYCTIKHHDKNTTLPNMAITALCALVFEGNCTKIFMDRVIMYWQHIEDENFFENLKQRVCKMTEAFNIQALFCDELHCLQSKFIGEFCHLSTPSSWNDAYTAQRAEYEQHIMGYPEDKNSDRFPTVVREAFEKSTSLTYLFVVALENISQYTKIASILLTTNQEAIDFSSESSRAKISNFRFQRDAKEDLFNFNKLVEDHFGLNLIDYLKKTFPDGDKICETWASRAVYFNRILSAIKSFGNLHPEKHMNEQMEEIWKEAEELIMLQAKYYVTEMKNKNKELYLDLQQSAVHNNGYLKNCWLHANNLHREQLHN